MGWTAQAPGDYLNVCGPRRPELPAAHAGRSISACGERARPLVLGGIPRSAGLVKVPVFGKAGDRVRAGDPHEDVSMNDELTTTDPLAAVAPDRRLVLRGILAGTAVAIPVVTSVVLGAGPNNPGNLIRLAR